MKDEGGHGNAVHTHKTPRGDVHRIKRNSFVPLNIPVSPLHRVPASVFILHPSAFILAFHPSSLIFPVAPPAQPGRSRPALHAENG